MFIEILPYDIISWFLNIAFFSQAAKNIVSVGCDSSFVENKSWQEDTDLENEIENDGESSNHAERLECWNICLHSDSERKCFTKSSNKNWWSNFLKCKSYSIFWINYMFWHLSFSSGNQENIINTNCQYQKWNDLSWNHCQLLVQIKSDSNGTNQRADHHEDSWETERKFAVNWWWHMSDGTSNVQEHEKVRSNYDESVLRAL